MKMEAPEGRVAPASPLGAWLVHLFTATGAFIAFMALIAVHEGRLVDALLWLGVALVVDGVDGTLARRARVAEHLPRIDGSALDLVIDYLNYVFIPAFFIWQAELIPEPAGPPLAAAILISALYNFARRDMKTKDNYFRGFPALWNVVALYLFILRPAPWLGATLIVLLALMTFAPVHVIHPVRVREFRPWLVLLCLVWAASTAALVWRGWDPLFRQAWLLLSIGSALLIVLAGLIRTVRGERPSPP